MGFFTDIFRSRVLPAVVAALGVSFIAAGLLTYTTGADAELFPFPSDGVAVVQSGDSPAPGPPEDPTPDPGASDAASPATSGGELPDPTGSAEPTVAATPIPSASAGIDVLPSPLVSSLPLRSATPEPSGSAVATATPTSAPSSGANATPKPRPTATPAGTSGSGSRVASRVVIPALNIDLPVVRPPGGPTTYPLCNVAMYIQNLSQPGLPGATYLYAHARAGMFLPLLEQSKINNGRGMLGMLVQVYTADNKYFLYEISEVRRHQLTLADAVNATDQELWLQTSEGPRGTPGKLQVIATPINNGPASAADARPTPHPVVCG
jgi:hypothetical protein